MGFFWLPSDFYYPFKYKKKAKYFTPIFIINANKICSYYNNVNKYTESAFEALELLVI